MKAKSGKLGKRHKQNNWKDRESLRIGGSRRISKMDHPRLCPRPVVCLHHGSAKRTGKTGEPGEVRCRRRVGQGDERVKRMKSSSLHFVTEVQNFRS